MIAPPPSLLENSSTDRDSTLVSRLRQSEIFRDYQRAFETITGLPLTLRAAGAFQAPLHGARRLNPFCVLMAARNRSCSACLQLQQRVEDGITREPRTLECFAGLSESAVPVWVGEKFIGYLQTGQVFLRPPTRRKFHHAVHKAGVPENGAEVHELELAYFRTRVVTPRKYESMLRMLTIFAQHLSAVSNQVMISEAANELPAIAKARAFILEHIGEELHLRDVARAVSISSFYFCKLFRRTTGSTFTRYLARLRVEAAKRALLNPQVRVTEAAYAAGFQSLSQFNRVFLRFAGETPSTYRDKIHGADQRKVPVRSAA